MAEIRERAGKQYVAGLMRGRYHDKVAALDCHLKRQGIHLRDFVEEKFPGTFTGTTHRKAEIVQGLLDDELHLEHWAFLRSKLRDLAYLTDRRHPEEYALDLALGWITEEWIRQEIDSQAGRTGAVKLIGIDSSREYSELTIRANADFAIKNGSREVKIDLMVDFLGTWNKNGYVDLKKGKVGHMKKRSIDATLAFDINSSAFYLITLPQLDGLKFSANAAMGGNQTVNVPLPTATAFKDLYKAMFQ